MKYLDSKGNELKNIHEWEQFVFKQNKKEKHWKEGRSAYEIVNFFMNKDGETQIKAIVEEIVNDSVNFEYGIPEMEVRFDCYGHGRVHDVGIFAKTEGSVQKSVSLFFLQSNSFRP